jgi:uncharacterized membrane protein required for colicin V production
MVFWIGILLAGAFAWLAVKRGFYETWALTFNVLISIYLAIFLGPIITDIVHAAGDTPYGNALAMMAIAIASFLILHAISYTFITGQFSISFPKIFDTLGTGFLGFLAGLLIWSFVALLIRTTPISQNSFVEEIGFGSQFEQTSVPYISWWCNLVNRMVSSKGNEQTTEQVISELIKSAERKTPPEPAEPNEPNEPNEPAEPNNVETSPARLSVASRASPGLLRPDHAF